MRGKERQNRKDKYNGKEKRDKRGGLANQYEEEEEKGKTEMIKRLDKESDSRRTWEERQGARKNNREIGHE